MPGEKDCKLSILLTFCNQSEYIKDALNSIINQKTKHNYEVLIGLDKPDNESRKIIKSYMEKYSFIKLFEIDNSNKDIPVVYKASLNRINLLKHVKGEYISLLDGDDFYCDENRFETFINFLDENNKYIGVFGALNEYDNKEKRVISVSSFSNEECSLNIKNYYKRRKHQCVNCYTWRNIFKTKIPDDLDIHLLNDSYFIAYMMRYGDTYYLPLPVVNYRVNVPSIYNSQKDDIKFAYEILFDEKKFQLIPHYRKYFAKNLRKKLKKLNCNFVSGEVEKVKKVAKKENCYFTYSILNYKNLSLFKKICFKINSLKFLCFGIYPIKNKSYKLFYFNLRNNFGDILNLYILQRIFKLKLNKDRVWYADLFAIGSMLSILVYERCKKICLKFRPAIIWGTGFIEREKPEEFNKKAKWTKVLALRGELSRTRMSYIVRKNLSDITLGDPGLLASKLIDTSKIEKEYDVGVILHYVDKDKEAKKNIKLKNYKLIDVEKNPIEILSQIAKCKVILSSAMHGLIAADSLNIPNRRLILSDEIVGGNYKFDDYYSAFEIPSPSPIDLRIVDVDEETIKNVINQYNDLNLKPKIDVINDNLIKVFNNVEG